MKHVLLFLLITVLVTVTAQAQINVGSSAAPDSSAMLQISGTTKGFLPPRMSHDSMYLIAKPARGLIVFNTTDSLLYMHRDSGWVALAAGLSGWSLTGNSNTNPATNFIGTTDNNPLTFRTNNAFRMVLDNDGGLFVGDSLASVASSIANTQAGVRSNWTTSLTSSNIPRIGLQGQIVANLTAASNAQQIRGANGSALIGVANGATSNADIYGGYFIGRRQSDAGVAEGTGTLTTLAGVGIEYGHTYTASSGGTTSNVYGIKLNPDYGSGTITNMYGLYVSAPLTGGTVSNLYDIYLAPQSLTGVTNNWGIYQANTKNNYFGGNIGIGTTSPSSKLHVVGTNPLTLTGVQTGTNTSADSLLTITNGLVRKLPLSTFSSSTNSWSTTGNAGTTATNFLGTTDSASVRFRTSNTQRLILDSLGNVAIGSNPTFTASPNRERLLIDAGSTASNPTTSFNLINARGYIDNYLQFNIQNNSPTASASTDIVASNDAATETANFIDMGINSSANTSTGAIGGAGTAYLYSTGNDFAIGNGSANKSVVFFTGGLTPSTYTERFRLDASGRVGIGTKTPASDLSIFQSSGTGSSRGVTFAGNSIGGTSSGTGFLLSLGYNSTGNKQLWLGDPDFANNSAGTFLRFNTAIGNVAVLDAVAGDNSSRKYVALGVGGDANGGVLFGSDGTATAPASYVWDNGNMTIGNGYKSNAAPSNGLLVQGNVGIGTTSPLTALHVSAASNPLTLNGVQTGTNTDSILTISGSIVKKLSPSALAIPSSNAWSLTGNTNTLSNNYFLGTTNSDPLLFKVNSQLAGRLDASNTFIGSLAGNSNGTTANQNTGIGYQALSSNTSGTYNTAIGYNSLQGNVSGSNNIGIGYGASVANNSSNSIAIGISSYVNNASSIAMGTSAQTNNTSGLAIGNYTYVNGVSGVAIGNGSSSTRTQAYGNYSVALGYNAYAGNTNSIAIGTGINSNASNSIAIGPSSAATVANSTALGASASAAGNNSTAIGYNAAVASDNTIIIGDKSNTNMSVGIGSESFANNNREKLLVDAGTTSSFNVISGKGSINNYLQLNIQNRNAGTNASSDLVATADNGDENNNYVDLGINSSANTANYFGAADDAYLYAQTQNMLIGTASASKNVVFLTGGGTQSTNERMRITGTGNVGIGTNAPLTALHVSAASNPLTLTGVQTGTNTSADSLLTITSGLVRKLPLSTLNLSTAWSTTGNAGTTSGSNFLGTTDNTSLKLRTNNTQEMLLDSLGNVAIGSAPSQTSGNIEKLLVDAGTTNSFNVISGKGSINNYLQLNIQNKNAGSNASSDVVATADNGDENNNYVDLGINSSVNNTNNFGAADDAYLYAQSQNMLIGTASANKNVVFLTGGGTQSTNERMRIDGTGKVGIANTSPTEKLDVTGNVKFSGALMPNNTAGAVGQILTSNGSNSAPVWATFSAAAPLTLTGGVVAITQANSTTNGYLSSADWNTFNNKANASNSWSTTGNAGTTSGSNFLGTTDNTSFKFRTNNAQRMLIDSLGNVAIGSSPTFTASPNQEKLLVDAGTTNSFNVISGKGNINNYLQLNIQNNNAGTAASSDVVATADNGNETTNYVDLGINSSANNANFFGAANDAYLYAQSQNMLIGTASASKSVVFLTGGGTQSTNERMRIDGSGNVGIGTTTPSQKLDVNGTIVASGTTYPNYTYNSANRIIFGETNIPSSETGSLVQYGSGSSSRNMVVAFTKTGVNSAFLGNDGTQTMLGTEGTTPITFRTGLVYNSTNIIASGSEIMRLTNAGNVGIGTNAPGQKLDVAGNINASGTILSQGSVVVDASGTNNGTTTPAIQFGGTSSGETIASKRTSGGNQYGLDFYTSSTNQMSITVGGNVGIGTNAPTAVLQLKAGTATAGTAPLKLTSGTSLSTAENGAVEYDGTNYFATSGGTRYTLAKTLTATQTLNFSTTPANTSSNASATITVTGATTGDVVILGVPSANGSAAGVYSAYVSAANTVVVKFSNNTTGAVLPASGNTFRVSVLRY